jgi:hypothetical protein
MKLYFTVRSEVLTPVAVKITVFWDEINRFLPIYRLLP